MKWLAEVIFVSLLLTAILAACLCGTPTQAVPPPCLRQRPHMPNATNQNNNDITIKIVDPKSGATASANSRSRSSGVSPSGFFTNTPGIYGTGIGGGIGGNAGVGAYPSSPGVSYGAPYFGGGGGLGDYGQGYGSSRYGATTAAESNLAPAPAQLDPNSAVLNLEVPHESAEVSLNNTKMTQKGIQRRYVTPTLDPNKVYTYALKVIWALDGLKHTYTADVDLKAGDRINHKVPTGQPDERPAAPQPREKVMPVQQDAEARAQAKLRLVKTLLKEGKADIAKARLLDIIEQFPDTKAAQEALKLVPN
jgi:uncharacterized protein (TIGR03000 family)